jgi:regulator of sigma E protease
MIGVMIMIHELGHYWAARYFDVHVETFSFGFGPRLFGFRKGETDFRFSLILFGGYVKMVGEQPGEETDDPRSFLAKPRWQRLIIAFAGPFMNIVLAVVLLNGLFMFKYPKQPDDIPSGMVGHVAAGSPAEGVGIRAGDRIVALGGEEYPSWDDILMKEFASAGVPMPVTVERDGQRLDFSVTPKFDEEIGVGNAGWTEEREVQIAGLLEGIGGAAKAGLKPGDTLLSIDGQPVRSTETLQSVIAERKGEAVDVIYSRDGVRRQVTVQPELSNIDGKDRYMIGVSLQEKMSFTKLSFTEAFTESVRHNVRSATLIFQFLEGLVQRRMSAKSLNGPIRIAQLSGDAARQGPFAFIGLMSMVSLNLAVFNLLPIPILDGGVILMLLVEMVMGRDLSLAVKETVIKVGFLFLMIVVVFVIYNDLQKVLPSGG